MTVEIVKHIEVELTKEEREVLCNARSIIWTLIDIMAQHQCNNVVCNEEYGDDTFYTLEELNDADTMMDCLTRMKEICETF